MVAEHISVIHSNVHKVVEAMPDSIWNAAFKFTYWVFVGSVISLVTGKAIKTVIKKRKNKG